MYSNNISAMRGTGGGENPYTALATLDVQDINNVLYFDPNQNYMGVSTTTPTQRLDVNGNINAHSLKLYGNTIVTPSTLDIQNIQNVEVADIKTLKTNSNPRIDFTTTKNTFHCDLNMNNRNVNNVKDMDVDGITTLNSSVDNAPCLRFIEFEGKNYIQSGLKNAAGTATDLFIGDMYRSSLSSARKFMIKSNGCVGIQTDNPVYELDVNGTTNTSTLITNELVADNILSSTAEISTATLNATTTATLNATTTTTDTLNATATNTDTLNATTTNTSKVAFTNPLFYINQNGATLSFKANNLEKMRISEQALDIFSDLDCNNNNIIKINTLTSATINASTSNSTTTNTATLNATDINSEQIITPSVLARGTDNAGGLSLLNYNPDLATQTALIKLHHDKKITFRTDGVERLRIDLSNITPTLPIKSQYPIYPKNPFLFVTANMAEMPESLTTSEKKYVTFQNVELNTGFTFNGGDTITLPEQGLYSLAYQVNMYSPDADEGRFQGNIETTNCNPQAFGHFESDAYTPVGKSDNSKISYSGYFFTTGATATIRLRIANIIPGGAMFSAGFLQIRKIENI